jgi:hypothetical protein
MRVPPLRWKNAWQLEQKRQEGEGDAFLGRARVAGEVADGDGGRERLAVRDAVQPQQGTHLVVFGNAAGCLAAKGGEKRVCQGCHKAAPGCGQGIAFCRVTSGHQGSLRRNQPGPLLVVELPVVRSRGGKVRLGVAFFPRLLERDQAQTPVLEIEVNYQRRRV